jgi:hypothetical protein
MFVINDVYYFAAKFVEQKSNTAITDCIQSAVARTEFKYFFDKWLYREKKNI